MHALIIDDAAELEGLAATLRAAGARVTGVPTVAAARAALAADPAALTFARAHLEDAPGPELAAAFTGSGAPPLVLASPRADTGAVVRAMRAGAAWFLDLPVYPDELRRAVEALAPAAAGDLAFPDPGAPAAAPDPVAELVGVSACIRNVKQLVRAAARTTSPVFIHGPTGTGKELVARSIHRLSDRARRPFVPVNCGALPEGLAESELFGAEKGAFTGAAAAREGLVQAADGGTLFLDELGEMPMDLQVKLLRVLQERAVRKVGGTRETPVDLRVVAATNRDPEAAVAAGALREDLYYRLVVLRVTLDPLKARPEDLAPLAAAVLADLRERYGGGPTAVAAPALEAMRRYPWPGNVRELINVLDLVFALGTAGDRIDLADLPERVRSLNPDAAITLPPPPAPAPEDDRPMMALREAELQMIKRALATARGNKAKAARLLGISRQALYRRLEDFDIDVDQTLREAEAGGEAG